MHIKYYQTLRLFTSFLFGSFGILAFSPYDFWPASIVACTNLLLHTKNSTWTQAIYYTTSWGIGFFGNGIYWVYISIAQYGNMHVCINIFLIICLILYLTLFPILFIILLKGIIQIHPHNWSIIIFSPILWSIIEYLRGHIFTGFPWLQFGYTQIDGPLSGIAPIFGAEGITSCIVLISALLTLSINTMQLLPSIIATSILFCMWPLKLITWCHLQPKNSIYCSLVQGNINQYKKWNPDYAEIIIQTYLKYTLSILEKTKIIIWPETAIPGNEINYNNFLIALDLQLKQYQTNLITGIIGARNTNIGCYYYNSMIVLGNSIPYYHPYNNRYDKHRLVLFSEKFPFKKVLEPLFKIFNLPVSYIHSGYYLQPQLNAANMKITAVICYEIIFSNQIRKNFKCNTNFLLTIANNAWFGDSIGPWQYLQMARMRAAELGRPLLCSTNNGITAVIDSKGVILEKLPQFTTAILNIRVIPTTGMTLYAKFGCWLFWLYTIIKFIILIIFSDKK